MTAETTAAATILNLNPTKLGNAVKKVAAGLFAYADERHRFYLSVLTYAMGQIADESSANKITTQTDAAKGGYWEVILTYHPPVTATKTKKAKTSV
jgi:hypothetical protein